MNNNTCVCCGVQIPEGRQICPICERKDKEENNMNTDLLFDLKDLRAEIGALSLANNINVYNLQYTAMKNKIEEIIKKVEDNTYEKK